MLKKEQPCSCNIRYQIHLDNFDIILGLRKAHFVSSIWVQSPTTNIPSRFLSHSLSLFLTLPSPSFLSFLLF